MEVVDAVVVGGGVVGLAIAAALSKANHEVLVLEREPTFGQGVSSRNSEVIHAGIYYPAGSLKARLCVEGKLRLYEYCRTHGVAYRPLGKLIVATSEEEEAQLSGIELKAQENGVEDLVYWSRHELQQQEPRVRATRALFSPSTGIVSSHELMTALLAEVEQGGGVLATRAKVEQVSQTGSLYRVDCQVEDAAYSFQSRILVNAAGLGASQLARSCEFVDPATVPKTWLCKGVYYGLGGASPFNHLIYPVPEKTGAGLGIHATLDLAGMARFGPNVEYLDDIEYDVPERPSAAYLEAILRYYPDLDEQRLVPAYAGIRPKLQGPGAPVEDFVIQGPAETGLPGFSQLFGIESPGLTAALAIGDYVAKGLRL